MEDDKEWKSDLPFEAEEEAQPKSEKAARARNKTVMLSPDITGQVRARLAQEHAGQAPLFNDSGESKIAQVFHQGLVPGKPQSTQIFDDDWESVAGKLSEHGGASEGWDSSPLASTPSPEAQTEGETSLRVDDPPFPVRNPAQHIIGREAFGKDNRPQTGGSRTPLSDPLSPGAAQGRQIVQPQGAQLQTAKPEGVTAIWTGELGPIVGFLVSYDEKEAGEECVLRSGRMIVSSSVGGEGNILFVPSKTVSTMHAILRMNKVGDIQILDQLSEHGTKIQRGDTGAVEEISGEKASLFHGDIVQFGERRFYVCVVFRPMGEEG